MMAAVASPAQDLDSVTARASNYVVDYEQELGTVIAEEQYSQTAIWVRPSAALGSARRVRRERRRLLSDYLILRAGGLWIGFRNVLEVDGREVTERRDEFEAFFRETGELTRAQLAQLVNASAEYNIGDIRRNFNLPTFALMVLRPSLIDRFQFDKIEEETGEEVNAWMIGFKEHVRPSFVSGVLRDEPLLSGRLWIDPATGRVLRTEVIIDTEKGSMNAEIRVRYQLDPRLGMWVPVEMEERYEIRNHEIEGKATYANFRRFEVEVKLVPE